METDSNNWSRSNRPISTEIHNQFFYIGSLVKYYGEFAIILSILWFDNQWVKLFVLKTRQVKWTNISASGKNFEMVNK